MGRAATAPPGLARSLLLQLRRPRSRRRRGGDPPGLQTERSPAPKGCVCRGGALFLRTGLTWGGRGAAAYRGPSEPKPEPFSAEADSSANQAGGGRGGGRLARLDLCLLLRRAPLASSRQMAPEYTSDGRSRARQGSIPPTPTARVSGGFPARPGDACSHPRAGCGSAHARRCCFLQKGSRAKSGQRRGSLGSARKGVRPPLSCEVLEALVPPGV